jgi:hypothetical protein
VSRKLVMAMMLGVLAASGAYVLVYLFRWEWHRAIITGIFFLAAELAVAVMVVLRKITRVEERLEALAAGAARERAVPDPMLLERLRATAPEAPDPFAWLDPGSSTTNVFLPFLLGVGAVASALAWIVEHVARRTAVPVLERRLAVSLAPLSLPPGGLVGLGDVPHAVAPPRRRGRAAALLVVGVLGSLVATAGIDLVADAIQTRPDARRSEVHTTIDVQLRGAAANEHTVRRAGDLWGTCSHVLHSRAVGATIEGVTAGRVTIRVPTDIGSHGQQRLRGCLEDAVVDRVQASVVAMETVAVG